MEVEYFKTKRGNFPVEKFIERQEIKVQEEIKAEIDRFKSLGFSYLENFPKRVKYIEDDIWELRIKSQRKMYRFLFIFVTEKIVFLYGFIKKTPRAKRRLIDLAKKRKKEYSERR